MPAALSPTRAPLERKASPAAPFSVLEIWRYLHEPGFRHAQYSASRSRQRAGWTLGLTLFLLALLGGTALYFALENGDLPTLETMAATLKSWLPF